MRINGYKHHTGGSSNKASSKKRIPEDGKIRIIPGTGHNSDNGKTLKENSYDTDREKIDRIKNPTPYMSDRELIEEGLLDYENQELLDDQDFEVPYYGLDGFSDDVSDILENIENKAGLDFLDFDEVHDESDKKALRLLQKSRVLSIEDNGANIDENTILYVREKKYRNNGEVKNVFVKEKITLKALFSYFATSEKNFTKALNMFIDKNNIIELDTSLFSSEMSNDGYLPRELKKYNGKPFLKIRKNAA